MTPAAAVLGEPRDHDVTRDRFLVTDELAAALRQSRRTIAELTRKRAVPMVRLPGTRKNLHPPGWIAAWINGARLEVIEQPRGGVIVRPIGIRDDRET